MATELTAAACFLFEGIVEYKMACPLSFLFLEASRARIDSIGSDTREFADEGRL